jgi:hypothetical protein
MKNYLVFFLLLMSFSLFSQNKVKKEKKSTPTEAKVRKTYGELGINVSGAIAAGGFRLKDNLYNTDPYFLNFKLVHKDVALRTGFGVGILSTKEIEILNTNQKGKIESVNFFNFKGGLEIQTPIDDKWRLYYGFDALVGYRKGQNDYSIDGGVTNISLTEKTFGLGPILGIQYRIGKRISLQTEATLYFSNTNSTRLISYADQPNVVFPPSTKSVFSMPIGIPRSLYVIIKL